MPAGDKEAEKVHAEPDAVSIDAADIAEEDAFVRLSFSAPA